MLWQSNRTNLSSNKHISNNNTSNVKIDKNTLIKYVDIKINIKDIDLSKFYKEDKKYTEKLLCVICYEISITSRHCSQCNCLICENCFECLTDQGYKRYVKCPLCKLNISVSDFQSISRTLKSIITEMDMKCLFYENGCHENIKFDQFLKHISNCEYRDVQCIEQNCMHKYPLNKIKEFGLCDKGKMIKCQLCNKNIRICEKEIHNLSLCPEIKVKCPECGIEIYNKDLKSHKKSIDDSSLNECIKIKLEKMKNELKKYEQSRLQRCRVPHLPSGLR